MGIDWTCPLGAGDVAIQRKAGISRDVEILYCPAPPGLRTDRAKTKLSLCSRINGGFAAGLAA